MPDALNLRDVPSVDEVVSALEPSRFPRKLVVAETRLVLEEMRAAIRAGKATRPPEALVRERLEALSRPSLQSVINATGVVLHTNLGRAPLPRFEPHLGYTNLEYDLGQGRRGKRDVHIAALLERLIQAPGIAVNNNAAAVYLALNTLAAGHEVAVSRGELIEIGDGFRIPDIMASSGAVLREVGTTNRTHIDDYREAINDRTRLLMRVHPSNFRIQGFTAKPTLAELAALAKERDIPLYEDLGSGCVIDLRRFGIDEPLAGDSLKAGVNLVSFSGDKLLGGPQAGLLAGDAGLIARLRRNPMFRALRLDKLIYQALETTLRAWLFERWDLIPTLRMIEQSADELRTRAERFAESIPGADVIPGHSVIGGGATPEQTLDTWLVVLKPADIVSAERFCRLNRPPVIARIDDGQLCFDLRTVHPEQEPELAQALSNIIL
ncbi:MAG TPA: L-seryl-tRNA(Sec) selenium transferase [Bryobacteraceae bacterium]|nr:L-seryl-tRNA(Sec) selenium transferase [Bryobacteraceae bacterium]